MTQSLSTEYWPGFGDQGYDRYHDEADVLAVVGSREGEVYRHVAPFRLSDGGRADSRRPKQVNDCTVRALAHVSGRPYDECYDTLAAAGRKSGRGFGFRNWATEAEFHGLRFAWRSFPAVKGSPRVNPVTFALRHPKGRFVLRLSKHVMACVDGVLLDSFQVRADRCVYGALEVIMSRKDS